MVDPLVKVIQAAIVVIAMPLQHHVELFDLSLKPEKSGKPRYQIQQDRDHGCD